MLLDLRINNLALIDNAEIQCGPGLNVLTGETGAGKSIIVQALGLLVGERAAMEHVGQGSEATRAGVPRALVEGAFDLTPAPAALARLRDEEIVAEDDSLLVIAREITADVGTGGGRSRVRLNGRLATAATLREIGTMLVDLHGQHEHQLLLRPESHLGFLDGYGDERHASLRESVRVSYETWQGARRRLDEVSKNEQQRAQRLDMLQFQAGEIDSAQLDLNEDDLLAEERARLVNAEKLRAAAAACRDALDGSEVSGAVALAENAHKAASEIAGIDASVAAWVRELESSIHQLRDAAAESRAYAESLEVDPHRLEEVEARIHQLARLKRKYGETLVDILRYRDEVEAELSNLNLSEVELAELQSIAESARCEYLAMADKLSRARRKLAGAMSGAVVAQLQTLALEHARFDVQFESVGDVAGGESAAAASAEGIDRVEFMFSANPGQPLRPLARIASGGEISRVMLALRTAQVATESTAGGRKAGEEIRTQRIPVIVFDEVDAGIGGVTAEAIGEKMQELARSFQVFCVTHLPQIAKRADRHYRVAKESDEEQTRVSVNLLSGEERVRELARMMGQESEANLRHARELLR